MKRLVFALFPSCLHAGFQYEPPVPRATPAESTEKCVVPRKWAAQAQPSAGPISLLPSGLNHTLSGPMPVSDSDQPQPAELNHMGTPPQSRGRNHPTDVPQGPQWRAERGQGLRQVLEEWTRREGVDLEWASEFDYPLEASFSIREKFPEAVARLLDAFREASPRPVGRLHPNGERFLLLVETRGSEKK